MYVYVQNAYTAQPRRASPTKPRVESVSRRRRDRLRAGLARLTARDIFHCGGCDRNVCNDG